MVSILLAGKLPIHAVRRGVLRFWGAEVAGDAVLYHGFEVRAARRLRVGPRSNIGNGAVLDARGGLEIGADVNLSSEVQVWTAQHMWNDAEFGLDARPVRIRDRAWLGARVIVLPGVEIGAGAVIAAGAVVTRDIPSNVLAAGVPAKPIAKRQEMSYSLPGSRAKLWWW